MKLEDSVCVCPDCGNKAIALYWRLVPDSDLVRCPDCLKAFCWKELEVEDEE